jgi:nucleotide-binding universal stress UspA family protein
VSGDPARAIIDELAKSPRARAMMTAHGRTAWAEAVLGSVALRVLRGSLQPLIIYHPIDSHAEAPKKISTVAIALDGSAFAERIIPFAVELAKSLAAGLTLIQALPVRSPAPAEQRRFDIVESSYLHWQAREIQKIYGVDTQWDVLHGDAADAICRHVEGMPETMLAMTSHGRGGLERAVLGSVAGTCIRRAGRPLLLHWPHP